ncbi:general transcription factor II-I repeat domain-containing protein 2-like, partial [Diabrotica undecimpunctata]|uniref:general transcription factor II-I repeat domain-containing protein 2-like n=1 Tax=Diabrotica undecimpunctata TaxID=50387 RepID=UPI003B64096E
MSSAKKRKILEENRTFQGKWDNQYFFIKLKGKPQCIICCQVLAVSKEYNISRHYGTQNRTKYDKYQGEARNTLVKELKAKLNKQKSLFTKPTAVQLSILPASYEVCLELVKSKKAFRDGEMIKQ